MAVCYTPGQVLGQSDLYIEVEDDAGNPTNAFSITYGIYFLDTTVTPSVEVLIPPSDRTPVNPSVGLYYASIQIPPNATVGEYLIRWSLRETSVSPTQTVVMRFGVVEVGTVTTAPAYSPCIRDLIHKFRVLTRDQNPARNYRFSPPQGEGQIGCYNQVFGFIWEDDEIAQYLEIALWKWNMHPPATPISSVDRLCSQYPNWNAALLWGSLVNAAQALAYNWVSQEFSISGETLVEVYLPDGTKVTLPIQELHSICKEASECEASNIALAFKSGELRTLSVDPETGSLGLYVIGDVMEHNTGDRPSVKVQTDDNRSVTTTCDHSLFRLREAGGLNPVRSDDLGLRDEVAQVQDGVLSSCAVNTSTQEPLAVSYDLCVPGPENFVLANGIVAHNSYSIGGISLDIERSSKYMDLKRNAEEQWDKLVEAKARTVKIVRGLKQPRFGRGVRSAFGPYVGRGILSPRGFLIFLLSMTGYWALQGALHANNLSSLLS